MKWLIPLFGVAYGSVALLFGVAGVSLIAFSVVELFGAMRSASPAGIIASLGTMAVALVALEVAQTVTEEEVIRRAHVSAPTRVRRYLSRFLVVVVVARATSPLAPRRSSSPGARSSGSTAPPRSLSPRPWRKPRKKTARSASYMLE
jgi:hypothetical protein